MAKKPSLITAIVLDTSYLTEIFCVPGSSTKSSVDEIRNRYLEGLKNNFRFIVPLPCIYELANHLAAVQDGNSRREIAQAVFITIESSVSNANPWIITPSTTLANLSEFFDIFIRQYLSSGISFTDCTVVSEAFRLKTKYTSFNHKVHIWTKERELKAREPDPEPNPFLG